MCRMQKSKIEIKKNPNLPIQELPNMASGTSKLKKCYFKVAIDTFLKNRKKNSNLNISFNIEDTNLKFWNMIVQSIVDQKMKKKIKNYKDGGL